MNPTLNEVLTSVLVLVSEPPPAEAAGEFAGARFGVLGMLSFLAAQEAEKGAAVRVAENAGMRAIFADAANEGWVPAQSATLAALAKETDSDLHLSALDAANARLRNALIALHTAIENIRGPEARQREGRILTFLRESAEARNLNLPGMG